MSKHARDRRPYIKPVTRLELSEKNIKVRWILICLLLAIAVVSIGYGFSAALSTEPGWQEVTSISNELNCSGDFVLMYDFGAGDVNPTAQYKKLEILYGELTESAYQMFSPEYEGTDNLRYLNTHVNEPVTVASGLYSALEQIVESGSRHPFMGPVRTLYNPVFLASGDAEAAIYDPMKDPELKELAGLTASYCADPQMISLELLGENRVKLNVSQEYLAFAEENGFEAFLDLGWMKNAFIIDYIADALTAQGHIYGYIASHDGFTRNLDIRGGNYAMNIFHRVDNDVHMPVVLEYAGPMSIVALRDYPSSERDRWNYYAYEDGSITTVYVDPADGLSRSAIDAITVYSREKDCAELLLQAAPIFIAETFDAYALEALALEETYCIYSQGKTVIYTEEAVNLPIHDPAYQTLRHSVK